MKARKLVVERSRRTVNSKPCSRPLIRLGTCSPLPANPQIMEVRRLRLANTVLAAYRDGVTDPDKLKDTAIRLMRHHP